MNRNPMPLLLISAVAGVVAAMFGAVSMIDIARPVELVILFAGAFGSGAALVAALYEYRAKVPRSLPSSASGDVGL
jgi:hypothetical protein